MILSDKQKECIGELYHGNATFVFYGGGAGGGKTWTGCFWMHNICRDYPNTRWFIGRDSLKDTRQSVQITFIKVAKVYGFDGWSFGDNCIKFDNGSQIDFLDLSFYPQKDPFFERLGSKEYTGGWIEEAGEVKFEAFDVLKSRIGRHLNAEYNLKSKILITANPKKNWLYSEFYKLYVKDELTSNKKFIQALHTHNPYLTSEYIENLNSIKDPIKRQRLLMGVFDYDDMDHSLLSFQKINDLFTNSYVSPDGGKFITCDLAITNDNFVIFVWDGLRVIDYYCDKGKDEENIKRVLFEYKTKYQVPNSNIAYDADGLGMGFKSAFNGMVAIHNGSSLGKQYANAKTHFEYQLAELVNKGQIYIACSMREKDKENLIEELQWLKVDDSSTDGKLATLKKSEIKQMIGRSPDLLDALKYRMIWYILWKK